MQRLIYRTPCCILLVLTQKGLIMMFDILHRKETDPKTENKIHSFAK